MSPEQCEIWWAEAEDRARPVLVVTRDHALPVLRRIMVAPITRTVRGIPTEVPLDASDGMREPCAASFDNLRVIPKSSLTDRIATARHRRHEICAALNAVADC